MSASNAFETNILELIFVNSNLPSIGDEGGLLGSTTAGSLYISLHTGDPGETGTQTTSECAYTNYARVAVARSTTGWTVSGSTAVNAAAINFPQCGGGPETITHFGIGTDSGAAGNLLFSGSLTSPLAISSGITPSFASSALTVTAD